MPAFDPTKFGGGDYDVTYCTMDGVDLDMDLYYPDSGGPWPAIIFVHGGAWSEGDKAGVDISPTAAGYLVASINYRLFPAYKFPAMVEDVKCAVRFLRANARQYNLDPERVALVGHSAGGHLVALVGLADAGTGWDVGPFLNQSSQVQAVVVLAGPADLTGAFPYDVKKHFNDVFGPDQLVNASPITYVAPGAPPYLIVHGDADPVVPVEQGRALYTALTAAGVPAELIIVQNGGHGFEPVNGPAVPPGDEIFQIVLAFLEHSLERAP